MVQPGIVGVHVETLVDESLEPLCKPVKHPCGSLLITSGVHSVDDPTDVFLGQSPPENVPESEKNEESDDNHVNTCDDARNK